MFTINKKKVVTGLLADGRHLVANAREEAASYKSNYGSPIPLSV